MVNQQRLSVGLDLRKNYILKVEGSKTGICYNTSLSYLAIHSLSFSLPTLLKLEVNDAIGTVWEFNFINEYLERYSIKPTQVIIYFRNWRDKFLEELR